MTKNISYLFNDSIPYKQCKRCVMDTTDPDIIFDSNGICNHDKRYDDLLSSRVFTGKEAEDKLNSLLKKIKSSTKKKYDCLIGVSGGVDSTYVAYKCKQLGLTPLAIHFDNGWNSELAVHNIEKTLKKLDIDLETFVINWHEFKDLQLSFLKASTPDGEIPTDHAIAALLYRTASKHNIKYIITGMNFATESAFVKRWAYGHADWRYIKDIHKTFGKKKLTEYPYFTLFHLFYWTFIKRIKSVSILNYLDYNKENAIKILEKELGWKNYGGKHFESIYTRFFQGYILPKKFNIDKRKCHLSDLIFSGQLTKEQALKKLEDNDYNEVLQEEDKVYVIKKLDLTTEEFETIMKTAPKDFTHYKNQASRIFKVKKLVNFLRKKGLYSK